MKISVIVPIYNMEKYIERAITCLKAQDEKNIEFILVNDGSTDSTKNILEKLCKKDKRFCIFNINNKGYGYACNYGIRNSNGEFWAIYEPDDCISYDFYSNLNKISDLYKLADVIRYNGIFRQENNEIYKLYNWEKKFTEKVIDKYTLKRFWKSHPSIFNGLYRKTFTIQKNIWFCETPSASFQDAIFMISLFYANPSIYIINKTKYTYFIHKNQSINFIDKKIDYIIESWKKEEEWINSNGIVDKSFYLYRIYIQMKHILNKVTLKNKNKIIQEFKKISKNNIVLKDKISSLKEKSEYTISIIF